MENLVFCKKYQEELPAMTFPPLPGEKGKTLMETVSQKALDAWRNKINEARSRLTPGKQTLSDSFVCSLAFSNFKESFVFEKS